jgi:hypothetical protein
MDTFDLFLAALEAQERACEAASEARKVAEMYDATKKAYQFACEYGFGVDIFGKYEVQDVSAIVASLQAAITALETNFDAAEQKWMMVNNAATQDFANDLASLKTRFVSASNPNTTALLGQQQPDLQYQAIILAVQQNGNGGLQKKGDLAELTQRLSLAMQQLGVVSTPASPPTQPLSDSQNAFRNALENLDIIDKTKNTIDQLTGKPPASYNDLIPNAWKSYLPGSGKEVVTIPLWIKVAFVGIGVVAVAEALGASSLARVWQLHEEEKARRNMRGV